MSELSTAELRELGSTHLARLLLRALRQVERWSVDRLHDRGHVGVRIGHIPVFANIDGTGTRITDLAARAEMTRQMMGRLVRELEEQGYVTSRTDPADQRAVVVTLTGRGWQFCRDANEVVAEMEAHYAELLGREGVAHLRTGLIRLAAG